jgi:hypothetical protein
MHHLLWSTKRCQPDQVTDQTVEWLTETGFSLINERGEITYMPHSTRSTPSTLDLTFANGQAITQDTVQDWAVNADLAYGSDHNGIQWTIDYGRKERT